MPVDPLECNPAEIEISSIDLAPQGYSWTRLAQFLSYPRTIKNTAPVSLP